MANKFPLVVDSVIKELATGDNLDLTGSGIVNLATLALSGELNAASLDISGNVDIDGVLETDGLSINGTTVTATAAQLNSLGALSSTTSSAAELNLLDGVTGLVQADFTKLAAVTATATAIDSAATIMGSVTATAAELNYLDIAALGTTAASKAVTANASGVVNFTGVSKFGAAIQEQAVVVTSGTTVAVNLNLGSVFTLTLGHNIGTFNITNPAGTGDASSFILKLTQDGTAGRTITWPSSVKWAAATAPTLSTAATNIDVLVFFTTDGGTTYYGFTAGQVLS